MKYCHIIILIIISVFTINAQNRVGIGTTYPKETLHIDANKDTDGTTTDGSNTTDDVIVTSSGALGIGLINPSSGIKLEVGQLANPANVKFGRNSEATGNVSVTGVYTTNSLKYGTALSDPVKAKLDIESSSIETGLLFNNGTGNLGSSNFIPIMKVDANDNAYWTDLPQLSNVKSCLLKSSSSSSKMNLFRSSTLPTYDITGGSGYLEITEGGLWLIYAKVIIGTISADASTSTDNGTRGKLVYMHLEESLSNTRLETVTTLPEATGAHVGILQLMYLYDAGSTPGSKRLKITLTSRHYQEGNDGANSGSPDPGFGNTAQNTHARQARRYLVYGDNTDYLGFGKWTEPIFFAIRIDNKN